MNLWGYVKSHKLNTLLILVILYLLFKNSNGGIIPLANYGTTGSYSDNFAGSAKMGVSESLRNIVPPQTDYAPAPEATDRKVIQESDMSIQVKNVREAADKIVNYAENNGGYMVNTSLSNPGEAPSGNITIRVPQTKLQATLIYLRSLGIKVVWENLTGQDVTDQYVDLDARIATLNKTLVKFREIFDKAVEVSDILNVQREIINIQSQIDSIKGQQMYLDKSAQMAKITINLSTDEFSLPYAPSDTFRPEVIFKQAVRSMVSILRQIGTAIIWLVVYSIIWIPALVIFFYFKNKKRVK